MWQLAGSRPPRAGVTIMWGLSHLCPGTGAGGSRWGARGLLRRPLPLAALAAR